MTMGNVIKIDPAVCLAIKKQYWLLLCLRI